MSKVITRMQEIVAEINTKLDVIQQESVSVGKLLIEAKEELQADGKKYADFIVWCGEQFNIGKAQASKLMKVATVFDEDERFKGVAMRVLYQLATTATPDQMDRAADFAATNSLTSAVANQLLNPTPVETEQAESKELSKEDKAEQNADTQVSLENLPKSDDVPFTVDSQIEANDKAQESKEANSDLVEQISELKDSLRAANELIQSLKDANEKQSASRNTAPFLPQFKSACPYAVLGLGQIESKQITKVKKAFRELIKCGYGDGHDAFEALCKAKNQLLNDIEKDKN